jgi:hypothetical protein
MLALSGRHIGEVKKYQQAFLASLPGNGCRESTNPTILITFVFCFYLYPHYPRKVIFVHTFLPLCVNQWNHPYGGDKPL